LGLFHAYDTAVENIGLRTQADWEQFIAVIRRNTPRRWRQHSEFESTANECLLEAIRRFDETRGVPFEGFLAFVASRRVKEVLGRYDDGKVVASTDEDWMADYLAERGDQPDSVAPHQRDDIAETDSMDVVVRLAEPLTPVCQQTMIMLAGGYTPGDVAFIRGTSRPAVSKVIGRIRRHVSATRPQAA
jgi:hypothetical protein